MPPGDRGHQDRTGEGRGTAEGTRLGLRRDDHEIWGGRAGPIRGSGGGDRTDRLSGILRGSRRQEGGCRFRDGETRRRRSRGRRREDHGRGRDGIPDWRNGRRRRRRRRRPVLPRRRTGRVPRQARGRVDAVGARRTSPDRERHCRPPLHRQGFAPQDGRPLGRSQIRRRSGVLQGRGEGKEGVRQADRAGDRTGEAVQPRGGDHEVAERSGSEHAAVLDFWYSGAHFLDSRLVL
mmetsp:Transcript_44174/g.134506  ORF Transcript_44174/g.134506 Transcript_44174/m.134506 type:complete len:235 (-) Transcript_44174:111-815(-)